MPTEPSKELETFDNPFPERDYIIEIETPEFTCLCPKTGQPDFADLYLEYVPDQKCVELKSLKLYLWSYRNEGAFHEAVTNSILNDLVAACQPRYMALRASFYVRGGIYTAVDAEFRKPGWQPPAPAPKHLSREVQELHEHRQPDADSDANTNKQYDSGFRRLGRNRRPARSITPAADEPEDPEPRPASSVFLGIDIGTSGCRVAAVDDHGCLLATSEAPMPLPIADGPEVTQDPDLWWQAVSTSLGNLFLEIDPKQVDAISVDATSATLLLCDADGNALTPALMYNDSRAQSQAAAIADVAGPESACHGAGSSLAKLLWMQHNKLADHAVHAVHQADWIIGRLSGKWGRSDYNNCLKLGYDVNGLQWPGWLAKLDIERRLLPEVQAPGDEVGVISADTRQAFGLRADVRVMAGTSDGVAAFLAARLTLPGQAVTSLGSTLVLKLLSKQPVSSPKHGVYSHKLGNYWLAGGASNSGGAVLLQYFKAEQLTQMTPLLNPDTLENLDYYPLAAIGERFPIYDPDKTARLEPLPGSSVAFYQGLLEGIAHIEADGYRLLAELGAPVVTEIKTSGGGSNNPAWTRIREKITGVKITEADSNIAAVGAALLATGIINNRYS